MTGPADIPSFGRAQPQEPEDSGVRNGAVRAALDAAVANPGPEGTIEVLRHSLVGFLLLDVTGSELELTDDGELAAGSTISIRGGEGPDGGSAIFAFTSHEQLAAMYPDDGAAEGIEVQSLVQESSGVLELVREQDAQWLCIDPGGPTIALSKDDLEFALRVPRNDLVRAALEPGTDRGELIAALRAEGPLSLAVIAPDVEPGVEQQEAEVQVRTTDAPDGSELQALAAFTSGPEVLALAPEDKIATQTAADVVALARDGGFAGLVINPGGPWAYVPAAELPGATPA